jgi:hypothetical protein
MWTVMNSFFSATLLDAIHLVERWGRGAPVAREDNWRNFILNTIRMGQQKQGAIEQFVA